MRIGLHYGRQVRIKGLSYLNYFEILIIMSLLLIAGIERNPGPSTVYSSSSTASSSTFDETVFRENFSIVHYNVQSILNKLDLIESELRNFDVICITETWLDPRTQNSALNINGFNLYRRDRDGDNHGGICVYVQENVYSCRRSDLELPNIESIWIEVVTHNTKQLIGTFYRPPNSDNTILSSIEDSIAVAFDTNIHNIMITGDFNLDMQKQVSNKKIMDLCQHYNLDQLITEPTHYTETSSSIIDLLLTSNKNGVLLSGVGEPLLEQNIRYHCPIFSVLNFVKNTTPTYERHIYLYDKGDYKTLSRELTETDWNSIKSNDIDIYAANITEKIIDLVNKHVPNKNIKVRNSDPPWLTNNIKRLMRKRKRLYDKYKKSNNINDFNNYKHLRNQVTREVRKSKKFETDKLSEKLENPNIGAKDWWKTLKQFIKPEQNSTIPPLHKDGVIYTDDNDKANNLNDFFVSQTVLDESSTTLPPLPDLPPYKLDSFISTEEVRSTLMSVKIGKASGPDSINNRLLKELAHPLSDSERSF